MDEAILNPCFQPESAGAQQLAAGEVHVWAVPLRGEGENLTSLLSAEEQNKASRFRFVDHRRRYTISHGALRAILGGYAGADPQGLKFSFGPRGKPYLEGHGELQFNLSHSSQMAMVALSSAELGVDLEKIRHLESLRDIARRHFSPREFNGLEAMAETEQRLAFYRVWTRKEAYIKALGAGLSLPLDVFDVSIGEPVRFEAFRHEDGDPAAWSLFDVSPSADYAGALAVRGPAWRLRTFALAL